MIREHLELILTLLLLGLAHSLLAIFFPLTGAEAMIWQGGALEGVSGPYPMVSWLAGLTKGWELGNWGLRAPVILLHLLTIVGVYVFAWDISSSRHFALLSARLYAIMPLALVWGVVLNVNAPLTMAFTWGAVAAKRAIWDQKVHYWYGLALCLALMFLSDGLGLLFLPGLLLILTTKPYRNRLKQKEPYLALLLLVAMIFPFYFTSSWGWGRLGWGVEAGPGGLLSLLMSQVISASPFIFIILSLSFMRYGRTYWRNFQIHPLSPAPFGLFWLSLLLGLAWTPILIFSIFWKLEPGWMAFLWPLAAVLVAAFVCRGEDSRHLKLVYKKGFLKLTVLLALMIDLPLVIWLLQPKYILPERMIYLENITSPAQPYGLNQGWERAGQRLGQIIGERFSGEEAPCLLALKESSAALYSYHSPGHPLLLTYDPNRIPIGRTCLIVSDDFAFPQKAGNQDFARIEVLEPLVIRDQEGILQVFHFFIGTPK